MLREELLPFYYNARVIIDILKSGPHSGSLGKLLKAISSQKRRAIGRVAGWVTYCAAPDTGGFE